MCWSWLVQSTEPMGTHSVFVGAASNCQQAQHLGAGLAVDVSEPINSVKLGADLSVDLRKMLAYDSYQEKAMSISRLMRATHWSPAEKAASTLLDQVSKSHTSCRQ